jgi:ribokinase
VPEPAAGLDVLVAGELYADLILSGFDCWPQPGQEAFAREFHREIGGGASITACGLARLGSRTGVLGVVGPDGAWLLERLRHSGVDTCEVRMDEREPTAVTVAVTSSADRAFFTYRGANRFFSVALADAARAGTLATARHLHLAYAPDLATAAGLFGAIRRTDCTVSLDVGWHPEWLADPRALPVLAHVDLFFPNEIEAHRITGETDWRQGLRRFDAVGVRRVALKLGARGAALLWDGEIRLDAPPRVTPLDPTGAGDCFDAGFLHAWLKSGSPHLCLRTANVCGALSTEAYGGIAAFPDVARLEEALKERT